MTTLEQIRALALQGISRANAEATIGRKFTPDELSAFRAAATVRQLKRAAERGRPKSTADRVAAWTARRNEVGEIPPPKDPARKAACMGDMELFGWEYMRDFLDHRASEDIKAGLLADAQACIREGGMIVELYGRGGGKTTWIERIGAVFAIVSGLKRFPLVIGATMRDALKNLKAIKYAFLRSKKLREDFPALCIPILKLGGISQRCASQTYNGAPTGIEWGSDRIVLPTLLDANGKPLDAGCGAIIGTVGIGGAIRGENDVGIRPDMLLIGDPQTRKIAASPKLVQGVLDYIHSDALGLAGHNTTISAFMTITPQRFGDVATQISSNEKYREWAKKVQPFIKTLPPKWDQLCELFCEQYALDMAAKDFNRPRSTAWYKENAALFSEMRTIDDQQFDSKREIDVNHHMLNLRAKMGRAAFNAELMMHVVDSSSEIQIDVDRVSSALNGASRGICPPGTDTVVGFCDVNIQAGAGLSWALVAFGPQRVAAVIDYGRFPADDSPLVPPNASDLMRNRRVAAAMREVVKFVASRRIRDARGRAVRIRAFAFDRGWLPDVVHRTLFVLRKRLPLGFPIASMRGFPWNKFGTRKEDMLRRGDHIFATRSRFGEYLAFMAPYWREVMQSGFLETPLMPGSLSIFGRDAAEHYRFAQEIVAERLVRKYQAYGGRETTTAWDWMTTGPEHFCDALTGCFALASWFRAYDALSVTIDGAALGVKPVHDDPLFDPMQNSTILDNYDGAADTTEGTLDKNTPRTVDDADLERDLEESGARGQGPGARGQGSGAAPKFRKVLAAKNTKNTKRPRFVIKRGKWKK